VRALAAAPISLGLALAAGETLPPLREMGYGLLLGLFSYGLSVVCAVRSDSSYRNYRLLRVCSVGSFAESNSLPRPYASPRLSTKP
jgi:hypothetical protein